jgi:hypothetical protein
MEEKQPMDWANIINNLMEIDKMEDIENIESTLLFKLNDLGIKINTAKNKILLIYERTFQPA